MPASNAATVRQNRKQSVFVHVKPTDVLKKDKMIITCNYDQI